MWIGIISMFPEMFRAITSYGITSRAVKNNLLTIRIWNPYDFAHKKHHHIDDRPYGGGPGMVMKIKPLRNAIVAAKSVLGKNTKVIYLSPQGRKLDHTGANELAMHNKKLILVCGRYEGIDERVIQSDINEEWSIGDYILSGGELPAMILIDSVSRFIPGVLGHQASLIKESFTDGLLEYPQYTRPNIFNGMQVPSVLLTGHHDKIRRWRLKQSLGRTWIKRPELLKKIKLTKEQIKLLLEFQDEINSHIDDNQFINNKRLR